jgi:ERCC4-type nuclease
VLYLDNRVGSIDLESPLRALGLGVRTGQYRSGDVWFWGNGPDDEMVKVGIERKNIRDLLSSIESGRLMGEQWPKLRQDYQRVYLLVEGITRANRDGLLEEMRIDRGSTWATVRAGRGVGALANAYDAFLVSVQEFSGMKVLHTDSPRDTARVCGALWRWWQKEYEDHSAHCPIADAQVSGLAALGVSVRVPAIVKMLVQVPGVGPKRAREIAKEVQTMYRLCQMTPEELQALCGKVTGLAIWTELRKG